MPARKALQIFSSSSISLDVLCVRSAHVLVLVYFGLESYFCTGSVVPF